MTMSGRVPIEEGLARLDALARQAAECVRPHLASAGMEGYRNFLNTMYHYTRFSGDKVRRAGEYSEPQDLKDFFEHMYREERGHYLLAEADLEALGYGVSPATPAAVEEFNAYWMSIGPEQYAAFVGALVVFENVAGHAADAVSAMVKRLGLTRSNARWLLVHVEADVGHGQDAMDLGRRYLAIDPAAVLAGAERACQLWIRIFESAFEDRVDLPPLKTA